MASSQEYTGRTCNYFFRAFHGSRSGPRVKSEGFETLSRVLSGRVWRCYNSQGSGRIESGGFQVSPPSGRNPDPPDLTRPARSNPTREKPSYLGTSAWIVHLMGWLDGRLSFMDWFRIVCFGMMGWLIDRLIVCGRLMDWLIGWRVIA